MRTDDAPLTFTRDAHPYVLRSGHEGQNVVGVQGALESWAEPLALGFGFVFCLVLIWRYVNP